MFPHLIFWLFFFVQATTATAHIVPANGSTHTTTHMMFEMDEVYGATQYQLLVYAAKGGNQLHKQNLVIEQRTPHLSTFVTKGLQFGNHYTWQYIAYKKGEAVFTSELFAFTILSCTRTDSNFFRQQTKAYNPAGNDLLLLDHAAMAIDKQGYPVWFLPVNEDSLYQLNIRDLTLSPTGTITHLDAVGAYEKKLNGTLLWKGPDNGLVSGSSKEQYHHQLQKLADGSYIVAGFITKPNAKQSTTDAPRFNTIIHYNADGTLRWHWSELYSMQHDSLFKKYQTNTGGGHLNGFAFTADKSRLLLSFKNLSDVWVLNYKTGLFETSIKTKLPHARFRQQHGPFITSNGDVLLYNNNISDEEKEERSITTPSLLRFSYQPSPPAFSLMAAIPVKADKYPGGIAGKEGYASETGNGNILVCAGGVNYLAEYNRKQQKVWDAYCYKRSLADTVWKPYSNYRCRSITSLYPLYYTIRYLRQSNSQYHFELHNAGSSRINLEIDFTTTANAQRLYRRCSLIPAGGTCIVSIPVSWAGAENFTVNVYPLNNKPGSKAYHYNPAAMQKAGN